MKRNPKAIIFDCDDTLLSYAYPFEKWMRSVHSIAPEVPVSYGLDKSYSSHVLNGFLSESIKSFNGCHGFAHLPAIVGAASAVARIKHFYPDWKIVLATCCGNSANNIKYRMINLERANLVHSFDDIHILPLQGNKSSVYSHYGEFILIDDNARYLTEALGCNGRVIKKKWLHNEHMEAPEFGNWKNFDAVLRRVTHEIEVEAPSSSRKVA